MKLRARLALTLCLLVIPLAVAVAVGETYFHRRVVRESFADAVIHRMETGGRERCERNPEAFPMRRRRRGRGRGHHRPRGPRGFLAYDASFVAANPEAQPFPAELREAIERGAESAIRKRSTPRGDMDEVAVRMPWSEGPCALVVTSRPASPTGELRGSLLAALLVSFGAILLAVLAAGPIVRRIGRLTEGVRRRRELDIAELELVGGDEIAELARAFNDDRAQIGEQLRKLEERDRALTEYIAHTTHDVMLPLTVMQGHLIALRQQAAAGRPADLAVLSATIEESHYLASLVHNLNAAARLEAGVPRTEFADVDLSTLVERVVARHLPIATHKKISLEYAVPDEPLIVRGDITLVERAVSNAVHNAVRYNFPEGHVAVVLASRDGGRGFSLRIIDDGPGIPEDELARITERSYRGNDARTRHPHGMGLGLHISRDVAARHDWRLDFRAAEEGERAGLEVELSGPRG